MARAALFAALTAALAHVSLPLPFSPVPLTGQTFGLMLSGLLLGARWGALAQGAYLLMGASGLPVFAGGAAGLGVLAGPTGGYLLGHVVGAFVVGWVAQRLPGAGRIRAVAAALAGGVGVVYALGVLQLALVTGMGWKAALLAGALPFLPGDVLKALVAALAAERLTAAVPHLAGGPLRTPEGS
ncbi:biotin synthase [Limnochorda pilosa]|uniref:Biotin transporter n=1 Tax=Limnochorda pilosa TaxID=1555112 RepID=A0A0K2SPV0_LIMPI|nr:biotin synthase [Limnochorda pilosa]